MRRVLVDGTLLSVAACLLILASARSNPRLWLQDLPSDIRDAVPPKTAAERRQSWWWGLPFLAVLAGIPAYSSLQLLRASSGAVSWFTLWLNAFGVMSVFNLVDLVIVDWLVLCWMTPTWAIIPGTEGFAGYKNYGHHFRGFLIGTAGCALVAAIIATGLWLS